MTILMVLLHLAAAAWAPVALFLTIPAHVALHYLRRRAADRPSSRTHCRCPDCRELVLLEARVCKHCSCKLTPQRPPD